MGTGNIKSLWTHEYSRDYVRMMNKEEKQNRVWMGKHVPSNEIFYACYLFLCIVQSKKQLQHEFEFFPSQFSL